jgi:hypothetical protein
MSCHARLFNGGKEDVSAGFMRQADATYLIAAASQSSVDWRNRQNREGRLAMTRR